VCRTEKLYKRGYLHILILYTTILFQYCASKGLSGIWSPILALDSKAGRERYLDYGAFMIMLLFKLHKLGFEVLIELMSRGKALTGNDWATSLIGKLL
jgi:hypothetical protein